MMKHKRLILGSQSPRRKEILQYFSIDFEQISPSFDEEAVPFEGDPITYVQTLSRGKALSLAPLFPEALVLTADTVVFKNGKIFNKPATAKEAFAMLEELNGSWHSVYTAVTVMEGEKEITSFEETHILFHSLSEQQLKLYHKAFKHDDKAGGYGIQMGGSIIVKRIEGCFYNVMGMPITATCAILKQMGVDLWDYLV